MFEGAKVLGAQVPVLLRKVAEGMEDIPRVVVAATDECEHERKTSGSKSTPSQGSRPRSEGGSGDGSVNVERMDMGPGPSTEEVRVYLMPFLAINLKFIYLQPLRVGTLWYLHVHTGDECFCWIKCKAVLSRSQLQLTWVKAAGGKAIISLDLLNISKSS
jgi:hypothetical protein